MEKIPVEAFVDLDLETCARIQRFHDRLEGMSLFEVLGVEPTADLLELRRGYFGRSKQFHPDRFFSRRLGPYKKMLERIFQWCTAAFKLLKDERQRERYKERVLRLSAPLETGPPAAHVVPVERDSGLEFVIAEETPVAAPPRRPRPRALEGDTFEFFVDEVPTEPTPGTAEEDDLEFFVDDATPVA